MQTVAPNLSLYGACAKPDPSGPNPGLGAASPPVPQVSYSVAVDICTGVRAVLTGTLRETAGGHGSRTAEEAVP